MDSFEINELVYNLISGSTEPVSIYQIISHSGQDPMDVKKALAILKMDERIMTPAPGVWEVKN